MIEPESAARFSSLAESYAANRPGYPPEAIDVLLEGLGNPQELVAADFGAGTGISSVALAERGVRVFAVEPSAAMRAKAQPDPRITWIDGSAERSNLANESVDLAAAFQAFHWFDANAAFEDFRRISRRRIAIVQYERDPRDPFTFAYGELVRRYATDETEARRARALERFAELAGAACERLEYRYAQEVTQDQMLGRVASTSYVPHDGPAAEAMRAEACAIFDSHAVNGVASLALVCYVLRIDV